MAPARICGRRGGVTSTEAGTSTLEGHEDAMVTHAGPVEFVPARRATFMHALAFVLGFSVVFIILGASIGVVGFALRDNLIWFSRVAGILLLVLGLHLTEIITIPFLNRTYQIAAAGASSQARSAATTRRPLRRYGRSLFVGGAFSVGWTPCVGPILAGILALAADSGSVAQGALLLVFYTLGLGVPFLIAGAGLGSATALLRALGPRIRYISVAGGILLVFMGVLIFLDRVTVLNDYFAFLPGATQDASATGGIVTGGFGFAIAFAGGVLSFLSPCVLPLVPIYIAHLAGVSAEEAQPRPAVEAPAAGG